MDDEKLPSESRGKPIRCRAAVSRKPGEPLVIEEIMVAPPMPHEVRIRIICTSLCHSDLSFWKMKDFPAIFPRILGHEAIGVVESVGEDVNEVTEGDTVIPTFMSECGECADCKSTRSNLCAKFPRPSNFMPRYGTSRFTDLSGEVLYHFLSVSSFTEYTVVDIAHITKIDPEIPPSKACLLSCGVSTGVGAAWRTANVEKGSTVAIFGLGSIGLAVAEGARLCGAARIIGVDVNRDKFEIGKKFGLTDFVDPANCENNSVSEVIKEMTGGGADYCFECVGLISLVQEAYACCRKGWEASGSISTGWLESYKGKDGRAGLVLRCLHLEASTVLHNHLLRPSVCVFFALIFQGAHFLTPLDSIRKGIESHRLAQQRKIDVTISRELL